MGLPNARSVCRVAGNGRAVLIYFDNPLSGEQMRELHAAINRDAPRPACTEHDWTCAESGIPGLLLWTCRHCNHSKILGGSMGDATMPVQLRAAVTRNAASTARQKIKQ
jgi:hypothetical protein